ncbi:MAG: hypothetical protein ACI8RZ_002767, partial [Myxococcota bacterium]
TDIGAEVEPADEHRWSEASGDLTLDAALNRHDVTTADSGPWTLRSTKAYGRSGSRTTAGGPLPSPEPMIDEPMDVSEDRVDYDTDQGPVGGLRAGATDDNRHFDDFITFLDAQDGQFGEDAMALNVRGKRTIQAHAADGTPLPGARVSVVDPQTDALIWTARTHIDGRAPLYPGLILDGYRAAGSAPEGGWIVQVEKDGVLQSMRWDGLSGEVDITLEAQAAPPSVDVCFIIDTTGSMGDEINRIKQTLLSVTEQLRAEGDVSLRYGAVLYRDLGDTYVTKTHPLTDDIAGFDAALQEIQAGGGGDGPESMNQGLAIGVGDMQWRPDSARVAFLIADAPPHMDYQGDVSYGRSALAAIHHGVRIHTVAASGLDDRGSLVFRQVAQLSGGAFIFIEYGSTAASAADHGVTAPVSSNNLDHIIFQRIHSEIVGWGVDDEGLAAR